MPSVSDNKWLIAVAVSLGNLMGAIDASIVNVAMPQIQGSIGASLQELTWISSGYTMALVILMPLAPVLGRRFGQKRLYLAFLCVFIAGSAFAAVSRSLTGLVVSRIVQGLGAGALQPTEQAILRQSFPPEQQGMAMAIFGIVVMLGPAIGPSLGGLILAHAHWSWIFTVNIPVGVVGFMLVGRVFHEDREFTAKNRERSLAERAHVDWAGIVLLSIALAFGEYVLEEGQSQDWFESRTISTIMVLSAAALVAFVVRELSARAPVVDLRLLRDRTFAVGLLLNATMMGVLLSTIFFQPLFMEQVLGYSPMQSATALLPRSLVMMVCMFAVGAICEHVSARALVSIGILVFALGAFDMSHFTVMSGSTQLLRSAALQGAGFALVFVPMETAMLSGTERHRVADATALSSVATETGGAIGLAIISSLFARSGRLALSALSSQVSPISAFRAHGIETLAARVATEATILAYEHTFMLAGVVFLGILPLVGFLRSPSRRVSETS